MDSFSTYGLVCPISKNIFYVGITCNLSRRFIQHKCNPVNKRMRQYLRFLKSKKMVEKIEMQILESNISFTDKAAKETNWIKRIGKYKILMNQKDNPRGFVGMIKVADVIKIK